MTIAAELEEIYASGDAEGIVLNALELNHVSFPAPVRVVAGIDADDPSDPDATIMLPIVEGDAPVAHVPCAFGYVRPGADKDGPSEGKLQIDQVSGLLYPHLKAALGYNSPIALTFRQYRVLSGRLAEVTGPIEVVEGLQLRRATLDALTAEGAVGWRDGRELNVPTGPDAFFDKDTYPMLFFGSR